MQKKRRQSVIRTLSVMAAVLAVLVACAFSYLRLVRDTLEQEARQSLLEVSSQCVAAIGRQISGDLQSIRTLAIAIEDGGILDLERCQALLAREVQGTPFKRMGLITPDGQAHTSDRVPMDLSGREYFRQALAGETVLSRGLTDYADGQEIYVYATPIGNGRRTTAVLFATVSASTFARMLEIPLFGGAGYSYIVDGAGQVLLPSSHPDSLEVGNLFKAFQEGRQVSSDEAERMRAQIQAGESGVIVYNRSGERRYMAYTPIGVNGWYVISAVSSHVVARQSAYLSGLTLTACVLAVLAISLLFAYILHIQNRTRRQLERLAYTDGVTGGRNWNGFMRDALSVLESPSGKRYALVILDIDKFKVFNDVYGHGRGNLLLRHIWKVLDGLLEKDEPFGRTSADNFNILMRYESDEGIESRLEQVNRAAARFGGEDAGRYAVELSFGVCRVERDDRDLSLLSDRASTARKRVKGLHDRTVGFYDHEIRDRMVEEKVLESGMEEALAEGQFQLWIQPKYSISQNRAVGAEALVRWQHPRLGLLQPGRFIPLFEENQFVIRLDLYMLAQTCRLLRAWLDRGGTPVAISVNMSRLHLGDPDFPRQVGDILREHRIPARLVELELTESGVLEFDDPELLGRIIDRLHEQGFGVSMDDFGSGYSSLNLLRELPVDVLKLDRGFFVGSGDTERGRTVVRDMVRLAGDLGIRVVAEGIETAGQVEFLRSIGCDLVQGFYFARPMPAAAFEALRDQECARTAGE